MEDRLNIVPGTRTRRIACDLRCITTQQTFNMASFTYPQHLLHKIIEPQWFPYQKGETESMYVETPVNSRPVGTLF